MTAENKSRWFWFVAVVVGLGLISTMLPNLKTIDSEGPKVIPPLADRLTASEHLATAKDLLIKKRPVNGAQIAEIEKHLKAIDKSAPQYKEAAVLLKKSAAEEKRLTKELADRLRRDAIQSRQNYVDEMERIYLKNGYDVHLSATGADKTIFTFKYVLVSRPLVYQLTNSEKFITDLRTRGFKKAIFTDGYRESWHQDL